MNFANPTERKSGFEIRNTFHFIRVTVEYVYSSISFRQSSVCLFSVPSVLFQTFVCLSSVFRPSIVCMSVVSLSWSVCLKRTETEQHRRNSEEQLRRTATEQCRRTAKEQHRRAATEHYRKAATQKNRSAQKSNSVTVHPQNVRFQNVRFQNIRFQNV